jgi:hypothetical protein
VKLKVAEKHCRTWKKNNQIQYKKFRALRKHSISVLQRYFVGNCKRFSHKIRLVERNGRFACSALITLGLRCHKLGNGFSPLALTMMIENNSRKLKSEMCWHHHRRHKSSQKLENKLDEPLQVQKFLHSGCQHRNLAEIFDKQ